MTLKHILKGRRKFPLTKLVIRTVQDESTSDVRIMKLNLGHPIDRVIGSNHHPSKPLVLDDVIELWVTDENLHRIKFCKRRGCVILAKTDLSFDVSRPRMAVLGGIMQLVKPPKAWLVAVKFDKASASLRMRAQNDVLNNLLNNNNNNA